jgi:hypothetical protein
MEYPSVSLDLQNGHFPQPLEMYSLRCSLVISGIFPPSRFSQASLSFSYPAGPVGDLIQDPPFGHLGYYTATYWAQEYI